VRGKRKQREVFFSLCSSSEYTRLVQV
jgi:hypothetical protein